jgi:dolichyl-phosphate beta-glucosyltransferase
MHYCKKIYLIVPCYNEANRLKTEVFKSYSDKINFVFVDDGSTDNTSKIISEAKIANSILHILDKNNGKATAVKEGVSLVLKRRLDKDDWIGFWDADLATPISEVFNMISFRDSVYRDKKPSTIIGCRIYRLGSNIRRKFFRHLLGRFFATLIKIIFDLNSYDSQCGAKIFKAHSAKEAFAKPFISSWIFDVEILLRLKKDYIVEYPLIEWTDVKGSKIKIVKDSIKIIKDIIKIKRIYKS